MPNLGVEHPNDLPLTDRQLQALRYLIRHEQMEHCSPTYSEMATALGVAKGQVQALLDRLEAKKCITRPHAGRGKIQAGRIITITPTGIERAEAGE